MLQLFQIRVNILTPRGQWRRRRRRAKETPAPACKRHKPPSQVQRPAAPCVKPRSTCSCPPGSSSAKKTTEVLFSFSQCQALHDLFQLFESRAATRPIKDALSRLCTLTFFAERTASPLLMLHKARQRPMQFAEQNCPLPWPLYDAGTGKKPESEARSVGHIGTAEAVAHACADLSRTA